LALPVFLAGPLLRRHAVGREGLRARVTAGLGSVFLLSGPVREALSPGDRELSRYVLWQAVFAVALLYGRDRPRLIILLLWLSIPWLSSISNGWPWPALGIAPAMLLLFLLGLGLDRSRGEAARAWRCRAAAAALFALFAISAVRFDATRKQHIYADRPASELTCDLEGVLPGGRGLRTNPRTCEYLREVQELAEHRAKPRFAIIPDYPGYWAAAPDRNPLPMDWLWEEDLATPRIVKRVIDTIETQRGTLSILVAHRMAGSLASHGDAPILHNPVVEHVRSSWNAVRRGAYFSLYE
jgi:hypothetical protein